MMVIKKLNLKELREEIKKDFSKDDTLSGFEIKKIIENLISRIIFLESKK